MEIISTPVSAMLLTVLREMPPEASVMTWPAKAWLSMRDIACLMVSGDMLSSRTASIFSLRACLSCSNVSTSISSLIMWPVAALALLIALEIPPAKAMWLSLMSIASSRR